MISKFDNYYFVDRMKGKLRKVNTVRFRPFPDLPPMEIAMDKVKFDSWGHLIIQVEPLEIAEAYEDEENFDEVIRKYLFGMTLSIGALDLN